MTEWFTTIETTPKNTAPSEDLARFVSRTYGNADRTKLIFLDIGSGSGANARWLRENDYPTITLDSSPLAKADICDDVSRISQWHEFFDCIIDINTLCHVEAPDYHAIQQALKPGGKFFSITPARGTEANFSGKGFTRISRTADIEYLLAPFSHVRMARGRYPIPGALICYWVIEADK